jgi:hypothetical protein
MEEDTDGEDIIRRLEAVRQGLKNAVPKLDHKLEKKVPDTKEAIDIFHTGINWIFAISVGTLVFILSNFDKFEVGSPLFMPYKNLYVSSIICVGLSSILLAYILGRLYWSKYMVAQAMGLYFFNLKTNERYFERFKEKMDMIKEQIELAKLPELARSLNDFNADMPEFVKKMERLDTLFDIYAKKFLILYRTLNGMRILLGPLVAYILGIVLISIYIIFFMYNYL